MADVAALVARVLRTYRDARTYEDEGTVVVRDGHGGAMLCLSLRTRFVRGGRLDLWTRAHDGTEVSLAWDGARATILPVELGRIGDGPELAIAIATLTGVTMGASCTVPGLLYPAVGGRGLFQGALRAGEPIEVDGAWCEVVHVRGLESDARGRATRGSRLQSVARLDTRVLVEPTTATVRRIDDARSVMTFVPSLRVE